MDLQPQQQINRTASNNFESTFPQNSSSQLNDKQSQASQKQQESDLLNISDQNTEEQVKANQIIAQKPLSLRTGGSLAILTDKSMQQDANSPKKNTSVKGKDQYIQDSNNQSNQLIPIGDDKSPKQIFSPLAPVSPTYVASPGSATQKSRKGLQKELKIEDMTLRDKLTLTPIEKYKKFGVFPGKLVIHIMLLFITAFEVAQIVTPMTQFQSSIDVFFLRQFMGNQDLAIDDWVYLYSVSQTQGFIQDIVNNYYSLDSPDNLQPFDHKKFKNQDNDGVYMFIKPNEYDPLFQTRYNLTTDNYGPFQTDNLTDIKTFLNQIQSFTLYYNIKLFVDSSSVASKSGQTCYAWRIAQKFNYQTRGAIQVEFRNERTICDLHENWEFVNGTGNLETIWIYAIALILCLVDIIRSLLYFKRTLTFISQMQQKFDKQVEQTYLKEEQKLKESQREVKLQDLNQQQQSSYMAQSASYSRLERKNTRYQRKNSAINIDQLEQTNQLTRRDSDLGKGQSRRNQNDASPGPTRRKLSIGAEDQSIVNDMTMQLLGIQDNFKNQSQPGQQVSNSNAGPRFIHDQVPDDNTSDGSSSVSSMLSIDDLQNRSDLDAEQVAFLMQRAANEGKLNWENLSIQDKLYLLNNWEVVGFLGCILVFFSTIFLLFPKQFVMDDSELFLGFGSFLIWIKTVKYFEGYKNYDNMPKTFQYTFPVLSRVIIGIFPFFIGSSLLACTLFWQNEAFSSLPKAAWNVFSLQLGDQLWPIWQSCCQASYIFGYLFTLIYDFVIISCVQSIFMVIVEDAYVEGKYRTSYNKLVDNDSDEDGDEDQDQGFKPQQQRTQSQEQEQMIAMQAKSNVLMQYAMPRANTNRSVVSNSMNKQSIQLQDKNQKENIVLNLLEGGDLQDRTENHKSSQLSPNQQSSQDINNRRQTQQYLSNNTSMLKSQEFLGYQESQYQEILVESSDSFKSDTLDTQDQRDFKEAELSEKNQSENQGNQALIKYCKDLAAKKVRKTGLGVKQIARDVRTLLNSVKSEKEQTIASKTLKKIESHIDNEIEALEQLKQALQAN